MEIRYSRWSWKRWLEVTGQTRPRRRSDQSERFELVSPLVRDGEPIVSQEAWLEQREKIQGILREFLGRPPQSTPPLGVRVVEEVEYVDFVRRKVTYTSEPGEEIPAYLFVPANLSGRAPAILTPHQTNYDGKLEPAGIQGEPSLALAPQLAERGYVALAADDVCFGERHAPSSGHYGEAMEFYHRHPQWSIMGKICWDHSRAIDFLTGLDFVDPDRIGVIGHSHGGYCPLWAAALDPRFQVVVASCGFDTFRADGNAWRWSHSTALLPRLGFYLGKNAARIGRDNFQDNVVEEVQQVPFDYHHVLALVAPRPLFLSAASTDEVFPHPESVEEAVKQAGGVYELYGSRDRLSLQLFEGRHCFPASVRRRAFAWLDRWLAHAPASL